MSPKSLSLQERNKQKERLFAKGRELLTKYGVHKTSVEDITKAAGMAKGSFYQYFDSKESFFFEIVVQFHNEWFYNAGQTFAKAGELPLKELVRDYLRQFYRSQEYLFFFQYHEEIEELFQVGLGQRKVDELQKLENEAYERLLLQFHIDTQRVKPGVVHNYLHTIYFGIANEYLMDKDCVEDTFEVLLNGLITYIFGGDI
jgi:AcrR family transcriptional regulator